MPVHRSLFVDALCTLFQHTPRITLLDATTGEGGHTEALLKHLDVARAVCVDRDSEILLQARERLLPYSRGTRIDFVHANFSDLSEIVAQYEITAFNSAVYDLGVSLYHYRVAGRGFSFQDTGVLDMRLDEDAPYSAHDIIYRCSGYQIEKILFYFGEERYARKIARAIVKARSQHSIQSAYDLQKLICSIVPKRHAIHPATKCFQALRIAVNEELLHIIRGLILGIQHLDVGGRMGVITFHSLEDRLVKHLFKIVASRCLCPESLVRCACNYVPLIKILTKTPILPTSAEVLENPSARSAKLRMVEKIATPSNKEVWLTIAHVFQQKISRYPAYAYGVAGR